MQSASEQEQKTPPESAEKARQWNRSLIQRLLVSIVAIPIALAFVWFGGWWTFAGIVLIVILGTYELHNMMFHSGYRPLPLISLGLSILFLVAAMLPDQRLALLETGLGAAVLVSFPWLFFRKKLDGVLVDWALTLSFSIYLGWPLSFFLLLRGFEVGWSTGTWRILLLLLCVWGFDSAAFFTGHFFGRHKLAPAISPGKTWEGVVGGLVASVGVCLLISLWLLNISWYLAIVLGLLLGIAAVLGDLAESLIKRQTHVKDSGQFLPGHGGILDRADSLLFASIVVYVFLLLIGKLS